MTEARFDDEIVDPGSVTDFSSSSVTSSSVTSSSVTSSSVTSSSVTSSSDCSVAYYSDGEPAIVGNRIAE